VRIKTTYDPKPHPNRSYDWEAIDEDTYDYDQPIGYGATEVEAIADLKAMLDVMDAYRKEYPKE
jgi:hypothetical protein